MKLVRLGRIWSFGWQGIIRNIWLSVIAIVTVALTVMSISVFVVTNIALNQSREGLEDKLDISIFIKDNASEEDVLAFVNVISERQDTKEVIYFDKEKSRQQFLERNKDDAQLLSVISELTNPFPRYVQIRVDDPAVLTNIDQFVGQEKFSPLVEDTSFRQTKDMIAQFVNFTKFILKNSIVITSILALVSVLVVFNMIRLAIFSRRGEIQIMRYVGASHQLIRLPFVVEGMILGGLAAGISLLMLFILSLWETSQIALYFPGATWSPAFLYHQYFWILFGANFGAGILLSAFISYIAVRRYLKEQ